jgi:3-methyladenine DNA glycosylase AlkD
MSLAALKKELRSYASPEKALGAIRFFKTGKGQYGAHDSFIGITVPETRKAVKKYGDLPLSDIEQLLHSKEHEFRLAALLLLVSWKNKREAFDVFMKNTAYVNNWDLVDQSAREIVGEYVKSSDEKFYVKLAKSSNMWERRIAIVATHAYIVRGESDMTFILAELLMGDKEDLMHKAVGWMLREVGKRCSKEELIDFLKKHHAEMPRTMWRYAVEHLSDGEKAFGAKKSVLR